MSTTKTKEADMGEFTVSDELWEIVDATNADGTVNVEIYDWEKIVNEDEHDQVVVRFYTPSRDKLQQKMKWPKMNTLDYKFVRICEAAGIGLAGAAWLKTDGAKIKADPKTWTLKPELRRRTEQKCLFEI